MTLLEIGFGVGTTTESILIKRDMKIKQTIKALKKGGRDLSRRTLNEQGKSNNMSVVMLTSVDFLVAAAASGRMVPVC